MRARFFLLALFLIRWSAPDLLTGQDLTFLTNVFKSVNSITLSDDHGWLTSHPNVSTAGRDCGMGNLCGGSAKILFDVTSPKRYQVQVGFGASYFRGMHESPGSPVEVRGALRSFPTIFAYLKDTGRRVDRGIDPYIGVNFGISELWNVQAYDSSGTEYALKAQTFDYGVSMGFYRPVYRSFGVFVEGGYRRRQFASVDWSSSPVPPGGPRAFHLDAYTLSVGLQVRISEAARTAPAYKGAWLLSRFDGKELPGVLEQHQPTGAGGERTEVINGTLQIDSSTYRITIWRRKVTLDTSGGVVSSPDPEPVIYDTGRVEEDREEDRLILRSAKVPSDVIQVFRVESDVACFVNGHILQFRRVGP